MALTISDGGSVSRLQPPPPEPPPHAPAQVPRHAPYQGGYRAEISYPPQLAAIVGGAAPQCGPAAPTPYGPGGFSSYVAGTQARELDVDFMRMSYATYDDGPQTVCGWTEVGQDELEALGWNADVRLDVPGSQFRAEVFTDGQGNYVLAYRGTQAEGAPLTGPDWETNYAQGAGLETDEFDRLAPQVAQEFLETLGRYGADGEVANLAITGHSQGGGLATVGSIVTGIPAVTFDASGVHPDTFDRLGIDIAAARETAADGQIRRYSMFEDVLTQLQEAFPPTAPMMPDALGAPIVVRPEGELDRSLVERALDYAGAPDWLDPALIDGIPVVRDVVRAAISHEQQLMIDTMLQQQPWQAGYENPSTPIRDLLGAIPDAMQDDYARNVGDFARDVTGVVDGAYARGDYVEGTARIVGDFGEGFFNSAGDTVDGLADAAAGGIEHGSADAAQGIRDLGWGGFGEFAAGVVEGGGGAVATGADRLGDGVEALTDVVGQGVETLADGVGDVGQRIVDFFR
ncbi:hypothetical protein [Luteimonas huabeiensis]|uniref:hypothetical protein n=1 Tax=Luteimonas huabeiensis TaxID=1244513 RepID=UPI000467984B|nr:hypothetical protein [Luteimonas huabeiensis]